MKIHSPIAASLLFLSGDVSISIKNGLWKLSKEKFVDRDLSLDLTCDYGFCESEVWGYAPQFNRELDYRGKVKVNKSDRAIELKVSMKIKSHA
jgi:hypothetical protein